MHLKDYFSHIFVINLPERLDRRREMERMLSHAGLQGANVSFFPGIKPKDTGGFRSIGAHGCFLSHLSVLEAAMQQGWECVLILEDDLEVTKQFKIVEKACVKELQSQDWDIVYFGHNLTLPLNNHQGFFQEYTDNILLAHFVGFHKRIIPDLVLFLQGLLKEPAGSPKGGPMDVDGAYTTFRFKRPSLKTLVANPSLGYQRSSRSDIAPDAWLDKSMIFRSLTHKVRQFKNYLAKHMRN